MSLAPTIEGSGLQKNQYRKKCADTKCIVIFKRKCLWREEILEIQMLCCLLFVN